MILKNLAMLSIGTLAAAALSGCAMQVDGDDAHESGEVVDSVAAPMGTVQQDTALPIWSGRLPTKGVPVPAVLGTEYQCAWLCGQTPPYTSMSATACIVPGTAPADIAQACIQALVGPGPTPVFWSCLGPSFFDTGVDC